MSVTSQVPYKKYTAAPGAVLFATTFRVLRATDLEVRVDDVVVTSGFTLSALGGASVDVTFSAPKVGGEKVELQRKTPLTRSTDYQQLGDFQTPVVNADFDRLWMAGQEMTEQIERSIRVPIGSGIDPDQLIADLTQASADAIAAADAAELSENAAQNSSSSATAAAAAAAASAASVGLPSIVGKLLNFLRVKADESGYEHRTAAQVRSDIGAAKAGADDTITSLTSLSSVNSGQLAGLRNIAINGGGLVQQSAAPTLTAALQYGAADQHQIGVTGGTSVSGTVGVLSNTGFSCGVGYGAIAASWTTGQFIYKHRMEGANTKFLNSKSVTVSGKLYQDTGGARNFTVSVGKPTTTLDTFSAVTTLGTSAAIPVSTGTVTPFSYTLAMGATDAALGLEVLITDNTANTVATKNYAVGDLQVEIGAVASVFEQRPYQLEVVLCKRYYRTQQFYWQAQSPGGGPGMAWTWTFDTPMRVAPTIAFPTVVIAGGSPATVGGQTVDGCGLYCPGNANGQVQLTATATSRL